MRPWIAVDLDGTLAHYVGHEGHDVIGDPIPEMKARVLKWIEEDMDVRIFTARVSGHDEAQKASAKFYIKKWLEVNGFPDLDITCCKDYAMVELYDDRAVQVEFNTGKLVNGTTKDEGS